MANPLTPAPSSESVLRELLDWSRALSDWQRDALRRLYQHGTLSSSETETLVNLLRAKHGLLAAAVPAGEILQPLGAEHLPMAPSSVGCVALKKLGPFVGVNALEGDSALLFKPGHLNVVFGNNGSGKSGFARVLKKVGRARHSEDILPNVYEASPPPPAAGSIQFVVDGVDQTEQWAADTPAPEELSRVSVFDSRSASIHVDGKNEAAYVPLPLELLRRLATVSKQVRERLIAEERQTAKPADAFARLRPDPTNAVGKFIAGLGPNSQISDAQRLASLSEGERNRLAHLVELAANNSVERVRRLAAREASLQALISRLVQLDAALSDTALSEYRQAADDANEKTRASVDIASHAFAAEPLRDVGSRTWKLMWEAARQFSVAHAYPGHAFPNVDHALCVLCQQPLSSDAANRAKRFEDFVRGHAEQEAAKARALSESLRGQIDGASTSVAQRRNDFLLIRDECGEADLAREVFRFMRCAMVRRARALDGVSEQRVQLPSLNGVNARLEEIRSKVASDIETLKSATLPAVELGREQRELEDRVRLGENLDLVQAELGRLAHQARIKAALRDCDTTLVTRRATAVADTLITAAWRDRFHAEMEALGVHYLRIELQRDDGEYGSAQFRIALLLQPSRKLGSILSEGEHRCVALAAFLSELAITRDQSTLVFDDPISSLDHDHRDAVARRIAKEAGTGRQVIVFTHDVVFLERLAFEASSLPVPAFFQTISRLPDKSLCGAVEEGIPPNSAPVSVLADGVKRQVKRLEGLFNSGRMVQWNEHTNSFSNQLRKCWERAVAEALAPVITRFETHIDTKNIWQVAALELDDCIKMRQGYKRCSELNHEKAAALGRNEPTPADYYDEIAKIKEWLSVVQSKQQKAQDARPQV